MQAYARLARLPPPQKEDDRSWRTGDSGSVNLEPRLPVQIRRGPKATIRADAAQMEQALINSA